MPVDFLTTEQQKSYGRYGQIPSLAQLARYFHLDDTDITLIRRRRGDHNRLGFAVQLGTVRFLGTFLQNPTDVPDVVVDYLAKQLGITDKECLSRYGIGETHWDHTAEIKRHLGLSDFSDPTEYLSLIRWLYTRAWVSDERPSVLLDLATARLVERKVLLPGVTVLARLISRVRSRVATRLYQTLACLPNDEQRAKLEALLITPEGARYSSLDRLRRPPTRISGPALVNALDRLEEIRALGVGDFSFAGVPESRIKALSRHAAAVRAQAITRMPEERRIATLLAFASEVEIRAMDDALDLLDLLVTELQKDAKNTGQKERIRTLRDLDAAALRLKEACDVLFDEACDDASIRSVVFSRIPHEELKNASDTVEALARPLDDNYYPELVLSYRRVRRFLPTLLRTVTFYGLRFVVPVRTINARPNSKYFGPGRGVTYYNFTSDQFTEFHSIVIPGTLRDSLYILEGLLEQETSLEPVEIIADTAGTSDVVFGLFWLLGYQFSPRLADVGETRFWRIDKNADYGALNGLARQRINTRLIERNGDDMLRVAGSLMMGTVKASELMRSLLRSKKPSTLARAIAELGRIPKTLYLLSYVDDENYRRHILTQINRHENRHQLSKTTFHGQRGEIKKRYREGQEDQLSALGLVVNAIVLWNTIYMEKALKQLRSQGMEVKDSDVQRLWPLNYKHINFLGRYSFNLPESVANGELRPLNNPDESDI